MPLKSPATVHLAKWTDVRNYNAGMVPPDPPPTQPPSTPTPPPDLGAEQESINLRLAGEKLRQELVDLRRPYLFRNPQLLTALITTIGAGFGLYLLISDDYFKVREQRNAFQQEQTERLKTEAQAVKEKADQDQAEAARKMAIAEATKAEAEKKVSESNRQVIAAHDAAAAASRRSKVLELEVDSRELASKAEEQLPANPAVARDLAIEAWGRKHTKDALKAILDAYSMPMLELKGRGAATFSSDGQRVVAGSYDGTAEVWDVTMWKQLKKLEGGVPGTPFGGISGTAFSPDGHRVVASSYDGPAVVWDVAAGKKLAKLDGGPETGGPVVFSPDGERVAGVAVQRVRGIIVQGAAVIWDATTGKQLVKLEGTSPVNRVAFSPEGSRLFTLSDDGTIGLWDGFTGKQLVTLREPIAPIPPSQIALRNSVAAFSPDGQYVVTGRLNDTAGLWDARTGKLVTRLERLTSVIAVGFSRDGRHIVTSSMGNIVKIWDAKTFKQLATCGGPLLFAGFPAPALSPDGKFVVTGSVDGSAAVWDATTGELMVKLKPSPGTGNVKDIVFSPDSKSVLLAMSGGFDGSRADDVAIYRLVLSDGVEKLFR
jgi:WD40 repeat protein